MASVDEEFRECCDHVANELAIEERRNFILSWLTRYGGVANRDVLCELCRLNFLEGNYTAKRTEDEHLAYRRAIFELEDSDDIRLTDDGFYATSRIH
jgi:hypothetical protein